MSVAVVTDSAAALPTELCAELGIEVVPLTVVVDGVRSGPVQLPVAELSIFKDHGDMVRCFFHLLPE